MTRTSDPSILVGRVNLRTSGNLAPNSRLPGNVIPSHYDISLVAMLDPDFFIDGEYSIEATVNIYVVLKTELTIYSVSYRLKMSSALVTFNDANI